MIIGILTFLLIDASMQLDAYHSYSSLTPEEQEYLDRIENPDTYALCE